MGTIQNHALLVTVPMDSARVREDMLTVKEYARKATDPLVSAMDDLIVEIPGVVNFASTIVMAPDGSKEYWSTSDRGDEVREFFIETFSKYGTVIEVQWGDHGTKVEEHDGE